MATACVSLTVILLTPGEVENPPKTEENKNYSVVGLFRPEAHQHTINAVCNDVLSINCTADENG